MDLRKGLDSMKYKVAIIGADGFMGRHLIDAFVDDYDIETIRIGRNPDDDHYLELTCPNEFDYGVLEGINIIIFLAAVVNQDRCAKEFDYCWNVMVEGTSVFIENSIERGCKVLFFSSDTVYDYNPRIIYSESSPTNPITAYGKMKNEVEKRFEHHMGGFKSVRLSYVVSRDDKFVSYCLKCIEKEIKADVFHPFYRNCITMNDVTNMVRWFIMNWDSYPFSYLNLVGDESISRVRIVDEINRLYGDCLDYNIVFPGQDFFANRCRMMHIRSEYLNDFRIIEKKSFVEKLSIELDGALCNYKNKGAK